MASSLASSAQICIFYTALLPGLQAHGRTTEHYWLFFRHSLLGSTVSQHDSCRSCPRLAHALCSTACCVTGGFWFLVKSHRRSASLLLGFRLCTWHKGREFILDCIEFIIERHPWLNAKAWVSSHTVAGSSEVRLPGSQNCNSSQYKKWDTVPLSNTSTCITNLICYLVLDSICWQEAGKWKQGSLDQWIPWDDINLFLLRRHIALKQGQAYLNKLSQEHSVLPQTN